MQILLLRENERLPKGDDDTDDDTTNELRLARFLLKECAKYSLREENQLKFKPSKKACIIFSVVHINGKGSRRVEFSIGKALVVSEEYKLKENPTEVTSLGPQSLYEAFE